MKKLILVTLLAVAASWLLSEARQPGDEKSAMTAALVRFDGGKSARKRTLVLQEDGPPIVRPPVVEAKPTGSIRTIPWKKGEPARSKRASAPSPARTMPPWFPKTEIEEEEKAVTDASGYRVLVGRVSASEDRARQDLRRTLEREVADWIAADVPTSWKVPSRVIDSMAQATYIQEVTRSLKSAGSETTPEAASPSTSEVPGLDDLYTLYRAGQKVDFSAPRRARIVHMYRQDLATHRMQRLGGGLALALAALAVLSTYIKADEATKGYYTNRLRLVAAAGLGVAGVVAYRYLV